MGQIDLPPSEMYPRFVSVVAWGKPVPCLGGVKRMSKPRKMPGGDVNPLTSPPQIAGSSTLDSFIHLSYLFGLSFRAVTPVRSLSRGGGGFALPTSHYLPEV